jgi:hypothetical protein
MNGAELLVSAMEKEGVQQIFGGEKAANGQAAPTGTRAPSIIVRLIVAAVVGLSNGDDARR